MMMMMLMNDGVAVTSVPDEAADRPTSPPEFEQHDTVQVQLTDRRSTTYVRVTYLLKDRSHRSSHLSTKLVN